MGNGIIKILQIGMTANNGGIENYLMNQYRHLSDNTKYDFINLDNTKSLAYETEIIGRGSKIYNVHSRRCFPIKHYIEMLRLLYNLRNDYDGLVLNTCVLYYAYPILIGALLGYKKRIVHSHNSGSEVRKSWLRKLLILCNRIIISLFATDYWACSTNAGKWMFGKNKFIIIPNAIDSTKFIFNKKVRDYMRKKLNLTNEFVVGNVARFSYQKNHTFLIDVFLELHKKYPNTVLLLIGGPDMGDDYTYYDNIKEKVFELGLESTVIFAGMCKDTSEMYQAMDCMILPSLFEGLPVTGIEAQAAGLPCLFSDTITKEIKITSLAHFCALTDSPVYWAEKIWEIGHIPRSSMKNKIISAGYDIESEVKKIEKRLSNTLIK